MVSSHIRISLVGHLNLGIAKVGRLDAVLVHCFVGTQSLRIAESGRGTAQVYLIEASSGHCQVPLGFFVDVFVDDLDSVCVVICKFGVCRFL